jgi:hypothetical protein
MTVPPVTTIRDRREELGERALELLGVDTTNPPGETAPLANRVEAWLENLGLTVERVVVDPAKPNLLASVPGDREATLLYLGHMDTVPFDGTEWSRDPLGERDGDRVYTVTAGRARLSCWRLVAMGYRGCPHTDYCGYFRAHAADFDASRRGTPVFAFDGGKDSQ